jgi:hypothetical protein
MIEFEFDMDIIVSGSREWKDKNKPKIKEDIILETKKQIKNSKSKPIHF